MEEAGLSSRSASTKDSLTLPLRRRLHPKEQKIKKRQKKKDFQLLFFFGKGIVLK